MQKRRTPWAVFIAIALGIVLGPFVGPNTALFTLLDFVGKLFLNALTMVVVPLVAASIITSVARIGKESDFGRLGLKTIGVYVLTNLAAIIVGILFVNLLQPGVGVARQLLTELGDANITFVHQEPQLWQILLQLVPANIFSALSQGQMLSIIVFSLLFGYCVAKLSSSHEHTLQTFFQAVMEAMIKLTQLVMRVLPVGVFCLVAKVFATTGRGSLVSLGWFTLTTVVALFFFACVVLPILVKLLARVSPWRLFRAMSPALVTAFSTSSSSATLPITLECVEERVGVSKRISSLVVPLGTSLNMSGSALYECVAALFVAQLYGVELSLVMQFLVLLLALVTSMGVAGVPAASLIAVILILRALGLPEEAVGIFLAVDRLLDMMRTTVNVFSDSCCAVIVARSEGERQVLKY